MKILTGRQVVVWAIVLAVVIELVTVTLRFGFKLESTRDTASTVGVLTHGIRIHHGYVGVLLVIAAMLCARALPVLHRWMLVVGIALLCSDLIHHFVVLWLIVGNPEFYIVYPKG
ncbi:MAG: hypothetical protein RDV41_15360 [Planctomycetota bacterium]|nr:hypothetical protein [Planctomycetota bacterium]